MSAEVVSNAGKFEVIIDTRVYHEDDAFMYLFGTRPAIWVTHTVQHVHAIYNPRQVYKMLTYFRFFFFNS